MFGYFWKKGVTDEGFWFFVFAGWVGGVMDIGVVGWVTGLFVVWSLVSLGISKKIGKLYFLRF